MRLLPGINILRAKPNVALFFPLEVRGQRFGRAVKVAIERLNRHAEALSEIGYGPASFDFVYVVRIASAVHGMAMRWLTWVNSSRGKSDRKGFWAKPIRKSDRASFWH